MAFALEFKSAGAVGDASSTLVASVDAGAGTSPDFFDRVVFMHFDSVEEHGDHSRLHKFAILKTSGSEDNVVSVPFSESVVSVVRGFGFVDDGAHSVLGFVAVKHLNFVTVLEIDAAVASGFGDEEFDVQSKVAVLLFGDDVGGAVFAASGGGIVGHQNGTGVNGIADDFPFDRQAGGKARPLPISPFTV